MKLFYQQMLGFFLIIALSIGIIGYSAVHSSSNQAYEQTYSRLEGYAKSLGELAQEDSPVSPSLDENFLNKMQTVMQGEDMSIKFFDLGRNQLYPRTVLRVQLPEWITKKVSQGKIVKIKNDHTNKGPAFSNRDAYTSIIYPWRDSKNKIIGYIWIGARVKNVEYMIDQEKRKLITALGVTMLIAIFLSFLLSFYMTKRIQRLSSATKKIADGDFDVTLQAGQVDEIDDLARNFNAMVKALRRSNDEIAAQEKRREEFMADASHEMRTPLTTINGILEGLQYNAIPKEAIPKSIELMQGETKRLIRLVNENLDYEKIRSNKITLLKTKFKAFEVLNNLVVQMSKKVQEKNDKLVLNCPQDLTIYADKDRFTQIMVNLIQNAIQFTKDGVIKITGKHVEHGAQFSVEDTGIGMSDDQKKFIFDRFYKADVSRAKYGSGESGLGLAIVLSLIRQHGGKIEVESDLNKGSKFIVTLYDEGYERFLKKE
ncbi:HAMP domain-containing histidine kinase [Lactobacillus sp. PV037]|uniref:sensor histidine kinase n=1 Tax=Lactobacillus sp. PV037 TaxID=2594496 RepID=UPI002240C0D8|nr:HAMP domain-containing sensor histidine kinase [Lactobacillus sp. PV037]QNQ83375.1 HAMP domain-containing histidine kinase [Lactobacillus sp. PV037]